MKETLKILVTFQGTFSSDSAVQLIILMHFLKKGNKELMATGNLDQNRHFSTLPECVFKPGFEGNFCIE